MDTKEAIMTVARAAVQARGYNALSFRELAKEVGVKSASIHYHFPTKGDLGAALARRYTEDAIEHFDGLLRGSQDPRSLVHDYTAVFRSALVDENRMCLCGIMAAEHADLPDPVRQEVAGFTEANVQWLMQVLSLQRQPAGHSSLRARAQAIFAALEGAQLVAHGRGDITLFDETVAAYRDVGLLP